MKRRCIFGILLLLFLVSCSGEAGGKRPAEEILNTLTSDAFAGRLYHTDGNQMAVDELTRRLSDAGLDPLAGDDFRVAFEAPLPVISGTALVLHAGGEALSLEEGVDYIAPVWGPVIAEGSYVLNPEANDATLSVMQGDTTVLMLSPSDARTGWRGETLEGTVPTLSLTPAGMDRLREAGNAEVTFTCDASIETLSLPNVLGVLPGQDRTKAVVLGAHFDHMGRAGDTIYRGAVDNASGVTALLLVADALSGSQPETDVVFAFWNGEEQGLVGSAAGAEEIETRYSDYCYINVDCIAYREGGEIEITTDNGSAPLCAQLEALLTQAGFDGASASDGAMAGDHLSFPQCGAVNLGQSMEALSGVIHRPLDQTKQLDLDVLEQFAAALSGVLEHSSALLVQSGAQKDRTAALVWPDGEYQSMNPSEQFRYEQEIAAQLGPDEFVYLRDGRSSMVVVNKGSNTFHTLEEMKVFYPDYQLLEKIGDFALTQIDVFDSVQPKNETARIEYNKVLQRQRSMDLILSVQSVYVSGNRAFQYRQVYSNAPMEVWLSAYEDVKPRAGYEHQWIAYEEDSGYTWIEEQGDKIIEISYREMRQEKNGADAFVITKNGSEEALMDFVQLVQAVGNAGR